MDADADLITSISQHAVASSHSEASLCRMMRHSVRKLLDNSGTVVHMQAPQGPARTIGFDVTPRLLRALRIAGHAVAGGTFLSWVHAKDPVIIRANRLRALSLGPHLRPLASGHLLLHRHADPPPVSRSVFVFIGVRKSEEAKLAHILNAITPSLHRAFFSVYQVQSLALPSLTSVEEKICRLLLQGAGNKEIARMLGKSEITVRNQLHAIFEKLGVSTRTAAAMRLQEFRSAVPASGGTREESPLVHLYY